MHATALSTSCIRLAPLQIKHNPPPPLSLPSHAAAQFLPARPPPPPKHHTRLTLVSHSSHTRFLSSPAIASPITLISSPIEPRRRASAPTHSPAAAVHCFSGVTWDSITYHMSEENQGSQIIGLCAAYSGPRSNQSKDD
ncbi:hypothetical protein Droror1_Dr00020147 [Drosera rotundifolia]